MAEKHLSLHCLLFPAPKICLPSKSPIASDLSRVRNKLAFDLMKLVPYHESLRTQFASSATAMTVLHTATTAIWACSPMWRKWVIPIWLAAAEKQAPMSIRRRTSASNPANSKGKALLLATMPPDTKDFETVLSLESDSGNHQAIIDAVRALDKDEENAPLAATFSHYFNRNNYLPWLATTILLGNPDTINQNFGLYQPLGSEKFYFLPWDYDDALAKYDQPGVDYIDMEIMTGIGNWWGISLHRRFMSDPKNLKDLQAAVDEIRNKYLTDANVEKLLNSYKPVVAPFIARQPDNANLPADSDQGTNVEQWEEQYKSLKLAVGKNYQYFLKSLQRPMPFWVGVTSDKKRLDWGWPEPFHPQGKPLTYRVQIAAAAADAFKVGVPLLKDISTSSQTSIDLSSLVAGLSGDYLVRVKASDPDNNWIYNFESYYFEAGDKVIYRAACMKMPSGDGC